MSNLEITTLLSEEKIQNRVAEMGRELTKKLEGEDVVAVCVLKGALMFYSDLLRHLNIDLKSEFMGVSSYADKAKSSGEVKLTLDLNSSVKDKHILLVEDIVDTGLTLNYLKQLLQARKPKAITTASLLLKPDALKEKCDIDHVGFEIPNDFVVGYGLDYAGQYRNLPYIGQVISLN